MKNTCTQSEVRCKGIVDSKRVQRARRLQPGMVKNKRDESIIMDCSRLTVAPLH